ncbi:2-oxoglutarate and iron-dependent oxygenase domain-containing protein [Tistrella mobilis]
MPLENVPIIDLAGYYNGTPDGKAKVAAEVGRACRDIGFMVVTGHQVPADLVASTYDVSRQFFDLPEPVKRKVAQPSPDQVRGYSGLCEEGLSYSLDDPTPPDLKESFSVGPIDVPRDDPYFTEGSAAVHFAPNLWPDQDLPALRPIWEAYFKSQETLAADLMRLFALALDLPEAFFDDKIDRHISMFRVLNYPDQKDEPLPGQMRAGAHSDYGSLTIVRQEDRPGGLQVRNKLGEWVDVPFIPGSFVVNIGDLMMQWTNDTWISTMHRVINPPRDRALDSRRISLVFFHQPNYDAMVSCLESCEGPGNPAKYAPVSSGDHLYMKFTKQTAQGRDAA